MQFKSFVLKDEAAIRLTMRKMCCQTFVIQRITQIFFMYQNRVAIFQKLFVDRILTLQLKSFILKDEVLTMRKMCCQTFVSQKITQMFFMDQNMVANFSRTFCSKNNYFTIEKLYFKR